MQEELNQAAAAGYRVLVGSRTGFGELGLLLEKVAQPPELYEYLLLATQKTSTMQKELDEAAAQGFRILPQAMMGGETEIVVILEKPPRESPHSQYVLIATKRTGILQKEVRQEAERGYDVLGLLSRKEHVAFMEKAAEQPGEIVAEATEESKRGKRDEYRLLATKKTSTMQKELRKAAEKGYCVVAGAPTNGTEFAPLLKKAAEPAAKCEYKLLATNKPSTLQQELNEAAAEGYRLVPQTVAGKRSAGGGFFKVFVPAGELLNPALAPDEIVAVMEKGPDSGRRYEYLVMDTMSTSTMQEELTQSAREGYEIAAVVASPSANHESALFPVMANLIVLSERASIK